MGVLDSLTNALGGEGVGMITGLGNLGLNQLAINQQMNANKEMTDYNRQSSEQMWDYTNYENQVRHAEKAGLNPAMLYAKGGAGGTTMNTGMSVTPSVQANIGSGIQTMQNQQSLEQQQQAIDNAKNVQDAQAGNLIASTGNLEVDKELKHVALAAANIEYDIQDATKEDAISRIRLFNRHLENDIDLQVNQIGVNKDTYQAQVEKIRNDAANSAIQGLLMNKQISGIDSTIAVNKQKIAESIMQLAQGWVKLKIDQQNADSNSQNAITNEKRLGIDQQNADSTSQNAQTNENRLKWEQEFKNVKESTKMTVDGLKFITQQAVSILTKK